MGTSHTVTKMDWIDIQSEKWKTSKMHIKEISERISWDYERVVNQLAYNMFKK